MSMLEQKRSEFWQHERIRLNLAVFETSRFRVKRCLCSRQTQLWFSKHQRQKLSQTKTRQHEKALTGEAPSLGCNPA